MITKEQAVDMLTLWFTLGAVILAVLALAGIGLWVVRTRRKAWEEYERRRDAIENGTRLANTRTKGGLPE